MALALIPHDQVVNDFNEIRPVAGQLRGHPMLDLLVYFERSLLHDIEL
jgi:hypothetical protein